MTSTISQRKDAEPSMLITDWLGWLQARLHSSRPHFREQHEALRHRLRPPEPLKRRIRTKPVHTGKKGRPAAGKIPAQPRHYWRPRRKVA